MASRRRTTTLDPQAHAALSALEVSHHAKTMAEVREFDLAATWGEIHPGEALDRVVDDDGHLILYGDQPLAVAGEGAPTVAEFCVPQLARTLGLSAVAGRKFLGAALEIKHRLPKLWARVMAGEVPVWKARRVAEHTHRLPPAGATYVDVKVTPVAHDCSFAQIEGITAKAVEEFDHERHLEQLRKQAPHRHLDIRFDETRLNNGLVPVTGLLDVADALALEEAIKTKAHALLTDNPGTDSDADLDVRRAQALGLLADAATAGGDGAGEGAGARQLVIYTHHRPEQSHGIIGLENTGVMGANITTDQLKDWCKQANTKVSIRPILDLDDEITTDTYAPTTRQREQAILTCPTCVFPGCGTTARRSDLDHIVAYADGGRTTSWNLAPLCRLHHRLKTLGFWSYRRLTRTSFEWTSAMGRRYVSDLTHKRRRTY